jgi:hypothetical protein
VALGKISRLFDGGRFRTKNISVSLIRGVSEMNVGFNVGPRKGMLCTNMAANLSVAYIGEQQGCDIYFFFSLSQYLKKWK